MIPGNVSPLALANARCGRCSGVGELQTGNGLHICPCVYRRVFRACSAKCQELWQRGGEYARSPAAERTGGRWARRSSTVGFNAAEYLADFELVARRTLRDQPLEYEVFWYSCLQRLPWRVCVHLISRNLGQPLSRGNFFHVLYRTEERLGQAFLELRPYSVLPCQYFSVRSRSAAALPHTVNWVNAVQPDDAIAWPSPSTSGAVVLGMVGPWPAEPECPAGSRPWRCQFQASDSAP